MFRVLREVHLPFIVHLCEGPAGSRMRRPMIEPSRRSDHKNAFAVIRGSLQRTGPDGTHVFRAGQMDDELPDYPAGGEYAFIAGEEGVQFWCIGRFPPGLSFRKTCVRKDGAHVIPAGAAFVLVYGTVNGVSAPLFVKPRPEERAITLGEGSGGMLLEAMRL